MSNRIEGEFCSALRRVLCFQFNVDDMLLKVMSVEDIFLCVYMLLCDSVMVFC